MQSSDVTTNLALPGTVHAKRSRILPSLRRTAMLRESSLPSIETDPNSLDENGVID